MKRLLLARHGQSVSNAVRRFQGVQDVPLSDLGRRQAQALAGALARRPLAAIYTSPLQRARHTAEAVAGATGAPLYSVHDLRELSLGEWEGCTVEEVRARPGDPYACWVRDPVAGVPPAFRLAVVAASPDLVDVYDSAIVEAAVCGMQARRFPDEAQADAWLRQP